MTDPLIYVVDDDGDLAATLARMLVRRGFAAEPFSDPEGLLRAYNDAPAACIITDIMMGDLDGFQFADRIRTIDPAAAIIFMTAWPTTADAVDSVRRHGGIDYLEKPIDRDRLLAAVAEGVAWNQRRRQQLRRIERLSPREREVFALLVKGQSTKEIALALNLSPRTVDDHRAQISLKTRTTQLSQLIALASAG